MRQQMFENFRKRQEEHDRQYCALTPAEKAAFLEKEIAEQERRRQEREAERAQGGGGGPGGNASGNSSGGQGTTDTSGGSAGQGGRPNFRSMTADQRLQMRKQMLDRTTPEARAQHGVYVNDMNNARAAGPAAHPRRRLRLRRRRPATLAKHHGPQQLTAGHGDLLDRGRGGPQDGFGGAVVVVARGVPRQPQEGRGRQAAAAG